MNDKRVTPFHRSMEQAKWKEWCCLTPVCKLYGEAGDCDILHSLAGAAIGDGMVDADTAHRMGFSAVDGKRKFVKCREFVPLESEG